MDMFHLGQIARVEFEDIAHDVMMVGRKLRITIKDDGFVDVWHSGDVRNRYKYHWVKDEMKEEIYRHDNAPDARWKHLSTFPKHFHDGSEERVGESSINDDPAQAVREFLLFVREKLSRV